MREGVPLDAAPGGAAIVFQVAALLDEAEVLRVVPHGLQEEGQRVGRVVVAHQTPTGKVETPLVVVVVVVVALPGVSGSHGQAVGEGMAHVGRQGGRDDAGLSAAGAGATVDGAAHVSAHQLLLLLVRVPHPVVAGVHPGAAGVVWRCRWIMVVVVVVVGVVTVMMMMMHPPCSTRMVRVMVVRWEVRVVPHGRVVLHPPDRAQQPLIPGRCGRQGRRDGLMSLGRVSATRRGTLVRRHS